ncbi:MAG: hypothetical protein ABR570_02795 [Burkholderiales bacterium]
MNPTAIYSKSGKGVQEASGKTSLLQRADRTILAAIDGRATVADVAQKAGKPFDAAFQNLITQLDKNGFIREVSSGTPVAPKAGAAPAKPAAKPGGRASSDESGGDLDFSSLGKSKSAARPTASPTPSPMEQTSALAKAREEAEAKAQAERERLKAEAEAKARAEIEAKARAEAEAKLKAEGSKAKAEAEAKVQAAREAAARAAADAKARAKAEAEAKAKLEAERKAREETERRLEAERKAREEVERKVREEADRARKEAEAEAKREAEELRQRLEEERKAREEAERRAKQEAERVRRELEEEKKRLEAERERAEAEARRRREEDEERHAEQTRAAKEEADRVRRELEEEKKRLEAERAQAERERTEVEARRRQDAEEERRTEETRAAKDADEKRLADEEALAEAAAAAVKSVASDTLPTKPAATPESFADSLLADLERFTNREEEDQKAQAEDDARKARETAAQRAREAAERARQAAERQAKEKDEAERRRRADDEARRTREDEERRAEEEERRKREAQEIRRKAEAATAAAMAKAAKKAPKAEEDIPIGDDDLDMDEVKREQAAIAHAKPAERKQPPEKPRPAVVAPSRPRRPVKWGKPVTMTLIAALVVGLGVAHVMPIGTADYERLASQALGRPVKIGSANLWFFSGLPEVRFKDVRVGDARIEQVKASGSPFALFSDVKDFSTIEVDGLRLPQEAIGEALFSTVRADNFTVSRLVIKNLELPGPAALPKGLTAEVALNAKGAMASATVRGPDGLLAKLTPKEHTIEFDVLAGGFTLPVAPRITLSHFVMKGTATPRGMTINEWGGAIFNGGISGRANVRWGSGWQVDGVLTVRNINAAVFAPALLSSGNGEGTAKFSMSGSDPASLMNGSRLDGNFTVSKGTLGSFDLARAIQSGGKQANGSTQFAEMNGQAVYDRGAVALRNVTIGAGALNAGASADITQGGTLSGRIIADMKTASRMLSATLLLGGTVKEPQVRN